MSDSKGSKVEQSALLRRKGKYIFELDADEENKQNPIQSIQILSDRCIMVRYKVTGLIKLFYVAVKVSIWCLCFLTSPCLSLEH